jgi:hypothetical protein
MKYHSKFPFSSSEAVPRAMEASLSPAGPPWLRRAVEEGSRSGGGGGGGTYLGVPHLTNKWKKKIFRFFTDHTKAIASAFFLEGPKIPIYLEIEFKMWQW